MAMENVITSKWSKIKSFMHAVFILVITVTLIVIAMPNTEKPRLTYILNEPWTSAQLISPGEIFIQKDKKLIEQEQREVLLNEYLPYYSYDMKLAEGQVQAFLAKYGEGVEGASAYCMQMVADEMRKMYETGVMPQVDYLKLLQDDSLASIMRVEQNRAEKVLVRDLYSSKQAYEHILTDPRLEKVKPYLQRMEINMYLRPNMEYDARRSEQAKKDLLMVVPTNCGVMKQGQEIINRGDIVTEEKARMIDSYNDFITAESHKGWSTVLLTNMMQWFYVMSIMVLFMMYIQMFRRDYLEKPRSLTMVYTMLTIFPILCSLLMRFDPGSIYVLPMCLVPMFIRVFLDSRTAFMVHVMLVLISAAVVTDKFEFIAVQIAGGIVAICSLRELYKRSQLFSSAFFIAIASIIVYTIIKFMDNKELSWEMLKHPYFCFMFNGVLLLLTYPLMFVVEKAFGFISPITLFELSDVNRDLLRKMSEVAPGTFQHSVTVSNLAAAIASEVGGKSLLVRTGALYHDIGKIVNPVFYTENQSGVNPHTRMTPQESAQIIIGHVAEGVKLAEKHGVPDVITTFILTHHGKGLAKYFYNTYCNENPGIEVDERPFRYPGPNPFSLEQAILTMADAVEAASRSLPEYTEESISALVNRIIDTQVAEGYFSNSPITFRDIATAKRVLIEKLKSIHHTRIQYPEKK